MGRKRMTERKKGGNLVGLRRRMKERWGTREIGFRMGD